MCSEAGTRTEMGSTTDQEERAQAAQSYLAFVGVGVFTHDALVVPDVLEGLAGETPARSIHICAHLRLAPMEAGPAGAGAWRCLPWQGWEAVVGAYPRGREVSEGLAMPPCLPGPRIQLNRLRRGYQGGSKVQPHMLPWDRDLWKPGPSLCQEQDPTGSAQLTVVATTVSTGPRLGRRSANMTFQPLGTPGGSCCYFLKLRKAEQLAQGPRATARIWFQRWLFHLVLPPGVKKTQQLSSHDSPSISCPFWVLSRASVTTPPAAQLEH